jgi:hypothetical protein
MRGMGVTGLSHPGAQDLLLIEEQDMGSTSRAPAKRPARPHDGDAATLRPSLETAFIRPEGFTGGKSPGILGCPKVFPDFPRSGVIGGLPQVSRWPGGA